MPVQIHYPDSNKVLDTYAILDNCSQGTFENGEIIEALDIAGVEAKVTVKTLNGEISQMTTVVQNLKVVVYLCHKQLMIGSQCCSRRINFVMADMDVFRRIIVQETVRNVR